MRLTVITAFRSSHFDRGGKAKSLYAVYDATDSGALAGDLLQKEAHTAEA